MVSHQLAKPITAIKWNLESLVDGDTGALTKEQTESATMMQKMAVDLSDLVGMILDVSRIQMGKIQLDPQPLELNGFFREVFEVIRPMILQKKINFVQKMPAKLPTILLDRRYARMVLQNLLTNAAKYTPEGGTVTVTVMMGKNMLQCSVEDTGCGIPKDEQAKIFGKMFRATNVRNTVEGNGFGLYVAKGAMEAQGGKLWFTSEPEKGSTFSFKVPIRYPAAV